MDNPVKASCPLCRTTDNILIADVLRRGSGSVFHCLKCDHGFLNSDKNFDLKSFYAHEYRKKVSHTVSEEKTNAAELYKVYKNYQSERLKHVSPHLHYKTELLEVGSSSGMFISHIINDVARVDAIELDEECCKFLEDNFGVNTDANYLENSKFAKNKYDVICAFQVMEHVENPFGFVKSLKNVTKKGGVIFIEVPNLYDPLLTVWNVPAYHQFYYHAEHLHYFSESSLKLLARQTGFNNKSVSVDFTQDYNILNHLHWIMNNEPQDDCHMGLRNASVQGNNDLVTGWLNQKLKVLNEEYFNLLKAEKCTSNLMMVLINE